jgi:hypothetical protein
MAQGKENHKSPLPFTAEEWTKVSHMLCLFFASPALLKVRCVCVCVSVSVCVCVCCVCVCVCVCVCCVCVCVCVWVCVRVCG